MSGISVRRIVSDQGQYTVAFDTTIDQFVSPPFSSSDEFADFAAKHLHVILNVKRVEAGWRLTAEKTDKVYDLTSPVLRRCKDSIAKLREGIALDDDEACLLCPFAKFLEDAIGEDSRFSAARERVEGAQIGVFNVWWQRERPGLYPEVSEPTPEERRQLGEYLQAMYESLDLESRTPVEVVMRSFERHT